MQTKYQQYENRSRRVEHLRKQNHINLNHNNMIQIINNKIQQIGLPKSGKLSTGESVSGYHLLDAEILKAEGWLPIEDNPPEYNPLTEVLRHTGWDIQADKVVKQYMVMDKPPTPNHFGKIRELEETLEILLGDEE